MTVLTLGEASFQVASYKIRELRQAAPYIEKVMARQREMAAQRMPTLEEIQAHPELMPPSVLEDITEAVHDVLMVISVGVRRAVLDGAEDKLSFTRTAKLEEQLEEICDTLEGHMPPADMASLHVSFAQVLTEAGLRKESPNPPVPALEGAGASASSSSELSQSSSQPASAAETGTG